MVMLDLQRTLLHLDFPLFVPGRSLLKSGILVKQGRRAEQERAFFLFTDILFYADVHYSWSQAVSSPHLLRLNSVLEARQSSPSLVSENSRKPFMRESAESHIVSTGNHYTFKRKIELADITVNGSDGCSFEIRSSIKSFSVVASTFNSALTVSLNR